MQIADVDDLPGVQGEARIARAVGALIGAIGHRLDAARTLTAISQHVVLAAGSVLDLATAGSVSERTFITVDALVAAKAFASRTRAAPPR